MSVNKKVLSVAIFGALVSGNAFAANLSAPGGAIPAYFAKEIIATPAAPATLTTSAAGATLDWNIGYNFSDGEVRYVRVECSDNIAFDAGTTATTTGTGNIGSINGLGSNVLTFSVTSNAPNVVAADTFTISGDHDITGTDFDVTCAVALYDQPSQAQAGGAAGRIANTVFSGSYLSFANSYSFTAVANTATADVEAVPAFTSFVAAAPHTVSTAQLSAWTFGLRDPDGAGGQSAPFDIDGTPITLVDLLDITSTFTVAGDFTPAANADGTFTGAALGNVVANGAAADALTATKATFDLNPVAGFTGALFNLTRTTGKVIQASDYVATLNAVSADPAVYNVSSIGSRDAGHIVRNGTELQAPLAQVPGGWLSRMALTNTGSQARAYTIKVIGETGNTIGTANLSGTVPANGTTVVDLNSVLTSFAGGAPRATLVVNVAGPNNQIQGLYQIVNPDSGSISNHVMVRPGTN